jgi:argininosuccinate synthase
MFRFAHEADVPAHIDLAFEQGIPIAVNGISMPLAELNESLTTIAADHGLGELADIVLGPALQALASTADDSGTGVVRMKLHDGEQTIVSVSLSSLASHP